VGQGDGLMERGPSRLLEAVAGFFIPRACREHVLGDLCERYTSPAQYMMDALRTVPLVIISRIRRTTDAQVLLMEAFALYLSYLAAASFLDRQFLTDQRGLLRLAILAAIALVALMVGDAYSDPKKRSLLRPILCAATAIESACLAQALFWAGNRELAVPAWIMIFGSGLSIVLVSGLRLLFRPVTEHPQGAGKGALWLAQTGEPVRIPSVVMHLVACVWIIVMAACFDQPLRRGVVAILLALGVVAQLRRNS